MSKKVTLKHAINGNIVTRQTARNYTHVLVGTLNVERAMADNEAFLNRMPKNVAEFRKDLEKRHANYRRMLATPIGQKCRNWNGFMVEMDEFYHEQSRNGLNDYGTIQEQVNRRVEDLTTQYIDRKKQLENIEPKAEVFSWHGSEELALKAGNAREYRNFDCHAEAINNGVED